MALQRRLADQAYCYLETVGRVSGRPREVEMWFAADPQMDRIFMLSGGGDRSHWVRNLRAEPTVRVRIGGAWWSGIATEVSVGPEDALARRLLAAKYQGWQPGAPLSGWARTSLPVVIELQLNPVPA